MASVAAQSGAYFMTDDRAARLAAAEAALTKVLSLVPNHAMAHCVLGLVQIFTNRAAQGIAECERALALDRNLAVAHGQIGFAKYVAGRGEETEAHIQEAFRLSPRDTSAYVWMTWAEQRQSCSLAADEEAVAWARRAIEANRNLPTVHFFLAAALALLGRLDEAQVAAQAGLALDPSFTVRRFRAGAAEQQSDLPRRTRALL